VRPTLVTAGRATFEAKSKGASASSARSGATSEGGARAKQMRGGPLIGRVEEWFVNQLAPGDTFVFAGQILRFEGVQETTCFAARTFDPEPKVPTWQGGKFPLSTYLAARVRQMIADPASWGDLPDQVREWLEVQAEKSIAPSADEMLIETFPRGGKYYLVAYPFDGRLAHQTLGMLLTRRLERAGRKPMGFVANDYALSIWGLSPLADLDMADLFAEDMLGDDLEAWLSESLLMKRGFRHCALISGLIERRTPGAEKTGRQVTFSTDLIYDVLRSHQPDHILLRAAWADASTGQLDLARLAEGLARIKGRIRHIDLPRVSPLAVPVMLEIGKEPVGQDANEALLAEAAEDLIAEAMAPLGAPTASRGSIRSARSVETDGSQF
jgi:ATP-dependent Lhr-like helicase